MAQLSQDIHDIKTNQFPSLPGSNPWFYLPRQDPPKLKKKTKAPPQERSSGFRGRSLVGEDPNVQDSASHSPSCPLGMGTDTGVECHCFTPIKQQ